MNEMANAEENENGSFNVDAQAVEVGGVWWMCPVEVVRSSPMKVHNMFDALTAKEEEPALKPDVGELVNDVVSPPPGSIGSKEARRKLTRVRRESWKKLDLSQHWDRCSDECCQPQVVQTKGSLEVLLSIS